MIIWSIGDLPKFYWFTDVDYFFSPDIAIQVDKAYSSINREAILFYPKFGYIQRSQHLLPEEGHRAPWRLRQNYFLDYVALRLGRIRHKELQFQRRATGKKRVSRRRASRV